jgi:type IV pilus assembly protein PilA
MTSQGIAMTKQKGFSLIELLIVVAIILIIAAIAIPNMMRAKIAANEASAVESLRTITTAEASYASTYGTGYTSLAALGSSGLLDDTLGVSNVKSGYSFFIPIVGGGSGTSTDPFTTFTSTAQPKTANVTGTRMFCTDATGVIRYVTTSTGCNTSTSPPIQ